MTLALASPPRNVVLTWTAKVAVLALVIACGVILAQIVWSLVAGADWNRSVPASAVSGGGAVARADFSALERSTPFRTMVMPTPEAAAAANPSVDTPETTLDLTLHGFRLDGDANTSIAVISSQGQAQQDYRVGDPIEGVAEVYLTRIYADGVVIERQGENEWLPKLSGGEGGRIVSVGTPESGSGLVAEADPRRSEPAEPAVPDSPENAAGADDAPGPRRRIDVSLSRDDVGLLAESVRFEGSQGGYAVYPTRNLEVFSRTGLEAGDVLTAVNGTELVAASDLERAMAELSEARRVEVDLNRNDEAITLVIVIGQ